MNVIAATVLLAAIGQPPSLPLVCPDATVSRGEVKAGQQLSQTFQLANRSAATIVIRRIEAGCGCLRRTLSGETIKSGETGTLTLEVNTLTQPVGPNRWQATIIYEVASSTPGAAGQQGSLPVEIAATIARDLIVTPSQLAFSTAGEASQAISLTDRRAKPLVVLKAVCSSPHLLAEIANPTKNEGIQTQIVTVKLTADAPIGQKDEMIVLITDDPAYPELRLPVRVLKRAEGGIITTPATVGLKFAPGQTEVSALVQLRSNAGTPLAIRRAECDRSDVSVKWSPGAGPVMTVRIALTATDGYAGSTYVRVKLEDPDAKEVVIPVSWSGKIRDFPWSGKVASPTHEK